MKIIKIKITERKLREYYGYAFPTKNRVEIRENLGDKTYLGTLIHEILHILYPKQSESSIDQYASTITHYVWKKGYRSGRKRKRK